MRLSAVALLLIGLAAPADAATSLYFSNDSQGIDCGQASGSAFQVLDLHVFVMIGPEGATGVRFRISDPGNPMVAPLGATLNGVYTTVGGPDTGIAFSFAGCLANETIELMTLHYMMMGSIDCTEVRIIADANGETGSPEASDCNFDVHPAVVLNQGFMATNDNVSCGYSPPPRDPIPADGATNVPVTLHEFEWNIDPPSSPCLMPLGSIVIQELYLGTDPDPPLHSPWWSPLNLQPNTTYYWRVVANNFGFVASSPVWSFTTENPSAVRTSTWGAVKALYR